MAYDDVSNMIRKSFEINVHDDFTNAALEAYDCNDNMEIEYGPQFWMFWCGPLRTIAQEYARAHIAWSQYRKSPSDYVVQCPADLVSGFCSTGVCSKAHENHRSLCSSCAFTLCRNALSSLSRYWAEDLIATSLPPESCQTAAAPQRSLFRRDRHRRCPSPHRHRRRRRHLEALDRQHHHHHRRRLALDRQHHQAVALGLDSW